MKKGILYFIFLTLFTVSCATKTEKNGDKKVVATTSIIADIARNIGGEHLKIEQILPVGTDPHRYEPTPRDAQTVSRADLILMNGLTLEGWLGRLIESAGAKAKTAVCTDGIAAILSPKYQNSADPHAWMSAKNGIVYAKNIAKSFAELDPEHAVDYEKKCADYVAKLTELDKTITQKMNEIAPESRILVTSHDAFQYFGRAYGVQLESVLGTSTDADAQTADLQRVTQLVKKGNVKAIFVESTVNPKLLEQIAKDNQIRIGGKLFSDSLGDANSGAATYLEMLQYNANTIYKSLF